MLARADDAEFLKAVGLVERIKTGRPKKQAALTANPHSQCGRGV